MNIQYIPHQWYTFGLHSIVTYGRGKRFFPEINSVVESFGSRGAPAGPQLVDVGRDEVREREYREDEKPRGKRFKE